jgi:hypothetical protein
MLLLRILVWMMNDVNGRINEGSVVTQWRYYMADGLKVQRQSTRNARYWRMAEIQTGLFHEHNVRAVKRRSHICSVS